MTIIISLVAFAVLTPVTLRLLTHVALADRVTRPVLLWLVAVAPVGGRVARWALNGFGPIVLRDVTRWRDAERAACARDVVEDAAPSTRRPVALQRLGVGQGPWESTLPAAWREGPPRRRGRAS